jgi:hypothetical protein
MKAPESKKLWFGFDDSVLMSWFLHIAPLIPADPCQVSIRIFPGALRLSSEGLRSSRRSLTVWYHG